MLQEDGTVSFIDYRTKFISIGRRLISKLPHLPKLRKNKPKPKTLYRFSNSRRVNTGIEVGMLRKASRKF